MERTMFNPDMESMSEPDRKNLERSLLLEQIDYVYSQSPMYREKFSKAGINKDKIKDPRDLCLLPFTTKQELRESQKRQPPFGDFLAAPVEQVNRVHRTSGTTGSFIYTALTRQDLDLTHDCGARAFWAGGLRPHHRVIHCLNYCMWMGGYTDHANLEATGAAVIPFGVGNSKQLIQVIKDAGINAISSTPSYPKHLEKVLAAEFDIKPMDLGLELGLFGGEPGLENPVYRERMEATWGMKAQNANYGVSDVLCNFASVCPDNYKLHFLGQGGLLVQLIDPLTLEDIPITDGAVGEMVLTHLKKQAQPLVRYRTSDLMEILETGPCECGRTGFRFRIVGRADDMMHVKGINVFPNGIAMVLENMVPRVTGEFQVVLDHPSPYTSLNIKVEHGALVGPEEMEDLKLKIETAIKETLNFRGIVELVKPDSIERTRMGKARRVIRNY
ncbi:phenylacetate--CoA ligase family protein [Desulfospira joergensenii]|uniref:phenylacetate--CoA ligase family protein n=1 Tax=Desulfospira joergensenii TaxID=53329 RepID=UPI000415BB73|nr:phenylacetate--CoA ligase family protein [Desulfospira joergensenii]